MTTWDSTVDFVIVGSGGGGMVAALAAADAGASALVLEKQALRRRFDVHVRRDRVDPEQPGDAGRRRRRLLRGRDGPLRGRRRRRRARPRRSSGGTRSSPPGRRWSRSSSSCGVRFVHCPGYSDYYSNAKGGHDVGRGIEPVPFDGRVLGDWLDKLQPGLAQSVGLAVMTNEARSLSHYNRSVGALRHRGPRRAPHRPRPRLGGQALLTNGASLIGAAAAASPLDRGIPIWTEAPLDDLVVEDGRVVGVRTVRDGAPVSVRARQGVLLAAGGFAHNPEMRERVRRRPAEPGQVVDRQPRRHRRGAPDRDAPRRQDRPDGRGVVAAGTPDRPVRAVDARPGPPAAAHDLRRRRRAAVRQRVELVHGGRQGDVRARQDEPGGAVLADLRRPLPQALRPPAVAARAASRASCSRAAG